MKVKTLIEQLKLENPEAEVCIDAEDKVVTITHVNNLKPFGSKDLLIALELDRIVITK